MLDQDNVATSSDLNPVSRNLKKHPLIVRAGCEELLQFVWRVHLDLFIRCLWPVAFAESDVGPGAAHRLNHYDDSLVGGLLVEAFFAPCSEQDHDVRPVNTGDKCFPQCSLNHAKSRLYAL